MDNAHQVTTAVTFEQFFDEWALEVLKYIEQRITQTDPAALESIVDNV